MTLHGYSQQQQLDMVCADISVVDYKMSCVDKIETTKAYVDMFILFICAVYNNNK